MNRFLSSHCWPSFPSIFHKVARTMTSPPQFKPLKVFHWANNKVFVSVHTIGPCMRQPNLTPLLTVVPKGQPLWLTVNLFKRKMSNLEKKSERHEVKPQKEDHFQYQKETLVSQ